MLQLAGVLVLVHAFVHLRLWIWGVGGPAPHYSWLIGRARGISTALAALAAALLGAAGVGMLGTQDWWPYAAALGALVSAALIALVFNRWLAIGLAIDAAILALAFTTPGA